MTIVQIHIMCNGPLTPTGPMSECDNRYAAYAYTADLARAHARRDGWAQYRSAGDTVYDLCPEHSPTAGA